MSWLKVTKTMSVGFVTFKGKNVLFVIKVVLVAVGKTQEVSEVVDLKILLCPAIVFKDGYRWLSERL